MYLSIRIVLKILLNLRLDVLINFVLIKKKCIVIDMIHCHFVYFVNIFGLKNINFYCNCNWPVPSHFP